MSFVTTVYVPEGIVMASDSRQSITVEGKAPDGKDLPPFQTTSSDFVYKVFLLEKQQVGISAFGKSLLGRITTESHIKRFSEECVVDKDDILTIPKKILNFFLEKFPKADTAFHIAGFKKDGRISIPYVYLCHVARNEIKRMNVKPNTDEVIYGAAWSGQADIISGILQPSQMVVPGGEAKKILKAPILWDAMTIQDAIDFAIYAVRTTIDTMRFQARPKNVGGPIDVLLLTPEKTEWIQRKKLHAKEWLTMPESF